jgi:hypothetical protein
VTDISFSAFFVASEVMEAIREHVLQLLANGTELLDVTARVIWPPDDQRTGMVDGDHDIGLAVDQPMTGLLAMPWRLQLRDAPRRRQGRVWWPGQSLDRIDTVGLISQSGLAAEWASRGAAFGDRLSQAGIAWVVAPPQPGHGGPYSVAAVRVSPVLRAFQRRRNLRARTESLYVDKFSILPQLLPAYRQ